MIRRALALVLLLSLIASSAEAVIGVVRDGDVHHEDAGAAATHALQTSGEHHHEDPAPHGPQHRHGTAADHCTHQHGAAVTTDHVAVAFAVSSAILTPPVASPWSDRTVEGPLHPPRA